MRPRWSPIDVMSEHGRASSHNGLRLHRSGLAEDERTVEARIPVTTVARTLLDLAEVLDTVELRRAFEEADRLKLLHMPELEWVCARAGRRKGLPMLRHLIEIATDPVTTRSPLEDRFAEFRSEHLADLPAPLTNVSILDHEVDAYWPSHHLVVEMDGFAFHAHRAAFERDRARDAAMQTAGYRVIHLTHRQLETEAPRIATQLRTMLSADQPPSTAQASDGRGRGCPSAQRR
jgi:very-short-patch-repair endonuclease